MRARASKGPAPNADGAAGTTHGAVGHGAPPGMPRVFGRRTHRAGGIVHDDPPGGATATAELRAWRGAGAAPEGARGPGRWGHNVLGCGDELVGWRCALLPSSASDREMFDEQRGGRCSRVSRTAGDTVSGVGG